MESAVELQLRNLIFNKISAIAAEKGVVTRSELEAIEVDGQKRRVIATAKGIWNPKDLQAALSVVSSPDSSYSDSQLDDSLFAYDYQRDSTEGDNTKLRRAYELALPIVLLRKIKDGIYVPVCPVYVVGDDLANRRFLLALDEGLRFVADASHLEPAERAYAERVTKQRLHQPEFRGRVLLAYKQRCTVCILGHGKLLDAAHIIGDDKPHGDPIVENGLSLCKIHHAAYDANLLGISPDYKVHINQDLMHEIDGPMLQHGLKEMHGRSLSLPTRTSDRPSKDRLAERFSDFRAAG